MEKSTAPKLQHVLSHYRISRYVLIILMLATECFGQETIASHSHEQRTADPLRIETLRFDAGAELLTFFFNTTESEHRKLTAEIPLFSILRDTLGTPNTDVHRLRYVWIHTYAQPSMRQRFAASVPFFYNRFGNAPVGKDRKPAPVIDFSDAHVSKHVSALILKNLLLDPRISLFEGPLQRYEQRQSNYLRSQLRRVSMALDMEEFDPGASVFSPTERRQMQRRLIEMEKPLGSLLTDERLQQLYLKQMFAMRQACAKNWELLRQRAEAEGLFFEPILLPDGTATHAVLFVAREDLENNRERVFDARFLNIGKPWGDAALLEWNGVSEFRFLDSEGRRTEAESAVKRVELIPLAVYGLDHPKVPMLLIDFGKALNAKRREVSRDALEYLESRFPMGPGFVGLVASGGKALVSFVTHRRGIDLFQQSRVNSYSQLKMVLSSNHDLSTPLLTEIGRRLEYVATNPIENDWASEVQLARTQYQAMLTYARRPEGLLQDVERDRRAEMMPDSHGGLVRTLFQIGRVSTLGLYTHREKQHPEMQSNLEARRLALKHEKFIRDVLESKSAIEVSWDVTKIRAALGSLAGTPAISGDKVVRYAGQLFRRIRDSNTRDFCLMTLAQMNTGSARAELTRLVADRATESAWREVIAHYLDLTNDSHVAGHTEHAIFSEAVGSNDNN